jgi:hypothetical protein
MLSQGAPPETGEQTRPVNFEVRTPETGYIDFTVNWSNLNVMGALLAPL